MGHSIVSVSGSFEDVLARLASEGWTDGLPVIPPTLDAVDAMLQEVEVDADDELGEIPPLGSVATIGQLAANAVMAGCSPIHFPVVLAAMHAMMDPSFNLLTVQATTSPATPLVVVHGPEARRLGVNGGTNVFGSGFAANAVIGRAVRLAMMNLGGAYPGVRDLSTQGVPAKFTHCIAENVDQSPWPEFHTTRGFSAEESAVSVLGVEGPISVNDHESTTPARMLDIVSDALGRLGSNNWYASDTSSEVVVVLGPEHANLAGRDGWSRSDVQRYIHNRCTKSVEDLSKGGMWDLRTWSPWLNSLATDPSARIPIVETADMIVVLVAGGHGLFSSVMTGMGNISRSVTKPIPNR